jgi:NAD(P)-dependent dehydrogenase (short-subunit alcohol dehydrogenase family)
MTQNNEQIENHPGLSHKRVVVLGGSSGIGLAVAQQAVAQGARARTCRSKGGKACTRA